MANKKKPNPRSIPKTEADCRREFDRGCLFGNEFCMNLVLWVLADKYGKTAEEIREFLDHYEEYTRLIREHIVKYPEIKDCLKYEYNIVLDFHAGYRDKQHLPLNGMNEGRE